MRYIGIDIGSSFIKGAVLDAEGLCLSHIERVEAPSLVKGLDPMFREVEPQDFVQRVRQVLERLHQHAPDAAGVLMCSQLHGMVLCDEMGRAQSRFITWQDQRAMMPLPGTGASTFDEIERLISSEERQQLGNERVPGVPLNYLFWFARHRALPDLRVIPASLPYFVAAQLCGTIPVSDITNAYGHGALNIHTGDWHHGVVEKLGLSDVLWPRIVPQGEVIGEWSNAGRSLPVFAPVGDYHCSQVGALLESGELSVNISTGSAVIQIAEGAETGEFQTRPWFDGCYLKTITHIPAGRALNALVRLLSELATAQGVTLRDPWSYIHAEAARADDGGLQVNPAFYTSNMGNRGAVLNLCEENMTVGHLFRAMLGGMANNYATCAARIAPLQAWSRLVFSGGVALKNEVLRELVCDRLGREHRLAPSDEDTLFGLLVLSFAFTGCTTTVRDAISFMRENNQPKN
ncbi:MAG: FGGY family carbohydrate kinase [Verrucomicrobiota bacterium]